MSTEILALLDPSTPDTWPQGILAAADLREQRAKAATPGPWYTVGLPWNDGSLYVVGQHPDPHYGLFVAETDPAAFDVREDGRNPDADAEHIAAEANPAHALAAVRRWRGVVDRHPLGCPDQRAASVPCDDLTETADEARAYLGGAT